MKFIVDAQLPPALTQLLRKNGHAADHAESLTLLRVDDRAIWEFATTHAAVVVTKDEDFADLVALQVVGPQVVWL